MVNSDQPKDKKPTVTRYQFYFETPLYEFISTEEILDELHDGEVDAYSAQYKTPTTYSIDYTDVAQSYYTDYKGYKRVTLKNKRKTDDVLIFFVIQYVNGYMKIGQMPSLADLQYSEITEKYTKQLNNENLALFKKAIGLAAHGVGAGSFVYLRKIFEALIHDTYVKHNVDHKITREDFLKLRMSDKVEALRDYLPSQLIDMKGVYSTLSLGVHELSEQDCLIYFQPIKLSIQLILDQQIEEQIKIDREKKVREEIKNIETMLKSSKK
jgi:hypothetical protein